MIGDVVYCDCKRPVPTPDGYRCRRCGFRLHLIPIQNIPPKKDKP